MGIEVGYGTGPHKYKFNFDFKYRKVRRKIEVLDFSLTRDEKYLYEYTARKDAFDVKIRHRPIEQILPSARKRRPDFNLIIPSDPNISYATIPISDKASASTARDFGFIREVDRDIRSARLQLRRTFEAFDT